MKELNKHNFSRYIIYQVDLGDHKLKIIFMGKQLEEVFKYYNVKYEVIERSV